MFWNSEIYFTAGSGGVKPLIKITRIVQDSSSTRQSDRLSETVFQLQLCSKLDQVLRRRSLEFKPILPKTSKFSTPTSSSFTTMLRTSALRTVRTAPQLPSVTRLYHQKVIDHYENPRNVGSLPKGDLDVGTGLYDISPWSRN